MSRNIIIWFCLILANLDEGLKFVLVHVFVFVFVFVYMVTMKKLIMYWWWGIAFGLMDESVPRQEMEDYHPDTRVTTFNLEKYGHLQERTATAF